MYVNIGKYTPPGPWVGGYNSMSFGGGGSVKSEERKKGKIGTKKGRKKSKRDN
jgi:hypothetical protein